MNLVPAALFPASALFLLLSVPTFYDIPCLLFILFFFTFYPCNSLPILVFFCNFPYIEILYKPQPVKTLYQSTQLTSLDFRQYREGTIVSPQLPPFSIFFHFLFHFLGCQTPFDDDKSKDVRLNLFLLEEDGCWLWI